MGLFGKKEKTQIVEPPIKFITDRQLPEFDPEMYVQTRLFVANALSNWAQKLIMTRSARGVQVQYFIDRVLHDCPALPADVGGTMMAMIKVTAGMDIQKPQARQEGDFEIRHMRKRYECHATDELSKTAERLTLDFGADKQGPDRFEDTGMRPKMLQRIKEIMQQNGIVLVSAPPKHGFSTTFNCTIRAVDRYLRNAVAIEDEQKPDGEVENAPITKYDTSQNQTAVDVLPKLLLTYPDVIAVRTLHNAETVNLLCGQPDQDRLVIAGMLAKDSAEAVLRVLALKGNREEVAKHLNLVINTRLIRKICDTCKQQYPVPPQLLKQLGIPQGKIKMLYRPGPPPQPPEEEQRGEEEGPRVCPGCNGIGYRGLTAIYETLVPSDTFREAIVKSPKLEVLRKAARTGEFTSLMDDGVIAASRGVTSIQEVVRVLKS